ncbi:hypothetical protein F5Y16DRAFT_406501 [Xylariaceae sp. FL0255]|nr:hypothetical protein F5Y16DRAFT_406501 [Xylariaceae sp. FL0255]
MKFEDEIRDTDALLTDTLLGHQKLTHTLKARDIRRLYSFSHLFILYIANASLVLALLWSFQRKIDPSLTIFSPVNNIIEYETKVFWDGITEQSPYQGEPTDEMDQMWSDLYGGAGFMMVNKETADKLPNKTAEVPGTGGKYIITLEMFHQLHCLNILRKHLYPDRFPEYRIFNDDGEKVPLMQEHFEHCIDRLRQGVQCSGDTGTLYWTWRENTQVWGINMQSTHSCRNFEKIRDWAYSINTPPEEIDPIIFTS